MRLTVAQMLYLMFLAAVGITALNATGILNRDLVLGFISPFAMVSGSEAEHSESIAYFIGGCFGVTALGAVGVLAIFAIATVCFYATKLFHYLGEK